MWLFVVFTADVSDVVKRSDELRTIEIDRKLTE